MKRHILSFSLLSACLGGFAAADTNFITADGNITDAANWDNGLPASGNQGTLAIDSVWNTSSAPAEDLVGWDLVITGGTLTDNSTGFARNEIYGGTTIDVQGGTWIRSSAAIRLHGGAVITVSGGTLDWAGIAAVGTDPGGFTLNVTDGTVTTNNVINFNNKANPSHINVSGGTVTMGVASNDTRVIDEPNTFFTVSGGSLTLNALNMSATDNDITVTLSGSGTLTTGSYNPNSTDGLTDRRYINILPGTTGSWTLTGATKADFETFWANDTLSLLSVSDPVLVVKDSDFTFGTLFHATGTDSTSRTVTFQNIGASQDLTIDAVTLTDDAGGVFSVTDAPTAGTTIAPGETFTVEITATGGSGYQYLSGELLVDVSHASSPDNDQDKTLPVTATIATSGDPYMLIDNGTLDDELTAWTGTAVSVDPGMIAGMGARVRGASDDRADPSAVSADNLGQAFKYRTASDFSVSFFLAIPDFTTWAGAAPDATLLDRSFHLAVMADTNIPGAGAFGNAQNANTLINLFYFPAGTDDGAGTTTPAGFHLYDESTGQFVHLPELGTLLASVDANDDGVLDPDGPDTINAYHLTITGSNFGTPSASYEISISDVNATTIHGTASNLTVSHGASILDETPKALVFTTADSETDSATNPFAAIQTSFWIDQVAATLPGVSLPTALMALAEPPPYIQMFPKSLRTFTFSLRNDGEHGDLTVENPAFSDPRFSILSPTLPVSIPVGDTVEFEIGFDARTGAGLPGDSATLTLDTNDALQAAQVVPIHIRFLENGQQILIDYDDGIPGNGVHEASIRSGGFEDNAVGQTFAEAAPWRAPFSPEGDDAVLVFDTDPATGLLHGQTSGWTDGGGGMPRAQAAQWIPLDEWTLAEGDSFTLEVTWKDGANFDTGATPDSLQFIIEVRDADGNMVAAPLNGDGHNQRMLSRNVALVTPGQYQTDTFTSVAVQPGSPWIGHRPAVRFLVTGPNNDRSHFALIDNVSLVAHLGSPRMRISHFAFDAQSKNVTLRWNDIGRVYKIQSAPDLEFDTGVVEIPLDGSEDTTTYPGEIQFQFNDPASTLPGPRFWRVVTE